MACDSDIPSRAPYDDYGTMELLCSRDGCPWTTTTLYAIAPDSPDFNELVAVCLAWVVGKDVIAGSVDQVRAIATVIAPPGEYAEPLD